jgi:methylated-DNA-[protein]-cysteine S-methyltransferase
MPEALQLFVDCLETPIGELMIVSDAAGRLRATDWTACGPRAIHTGRAGCGVEPDDDKGRLLQQLQQQYGVKIALEPATDPGGLTAALKAYFGGDLAAIDPLPVETAGTPFQRAVWNALRRIPCGTTISYAELARRIGRPSAVRAVGLANGSNPVSIVVPCHRVIGSNGTLTGYGGGLERKRWLLAHEGRMPVLFR